MWPHGAPDWAQRVLRDNIQTREQLTALGAKLDLVMVAVERGLNEAIAARHEVSEVSRSIGSLRTRLAGYAEDSETRHTDSESRIRALEARVGANGFGGHD